MSKAASVSSDARKYGYDVAAKMHGIKRETARRYCRNDTRGKRPAKSVTAIDNSDINKIAERYTRAELHAIANGGMTMQTKDKILIEPTKSVYRIGVITDTHYGSKYTNPDLTLCAFQEFAKAGVDAIFHCGDVTEGMSNRPGHVYECTHIGYEAQRDHAIDVLSQWTETPIYMIDGNHDRWFQQACGAHIVSDICDSIDNAEFLGHDEGDICVGPVSIKLWHGQDGSSYAFSYRVQKIVESFTGGEKPNVFLCGHTHKALYVYDRHVHCLSAGSMQAQSKWMRSNRHASHTGFWTAEIGIGKSGVTHFSPRWIPAYV